MSVVIHVPCAARSLCAGIDDAGKVTSTETV